MGWRLNVARQAITVRLPFNAELRRFKRRIFGYEPDPHNLQGTIANFERMMATVQRAGRTVRGATVVEIGSGWFPTIPILLALHGARRVYMTDIAHRIDEGTFTSTLRFLRSVLPEEQRLNEIHRIEDLPLVYLAPFESAELADLSIDLVTSRTVLEHIPPPDIVKLFRSLHPKLTESGLMVHLIDHSDHLEHRDKSISKINFLTWTAKKHAMVNTLIREGENRLRHHEYRPLFEASGYSVLDEWADVDATTREIAGRLRMAPPYNRMSADQVAILTSIYVLKKVDMPA